MPTPNAVREIFKQGRDDNPSSWRWIIAFYEYVTALPVWGERHLPLLHLVHQIAGSPDAAYFRAGQSLHDLLISTKSKNGLDEDDPYVRVAAELKTPMFRVEYWRGEQSADDMMESYTVNESQLLDTIKPLLARLRSEARAPEASAHKE